MRLFIVLFILVFSGCSNGLARIQRVDSKTITLTSIYWGSSELNEMTEGMVQSILKSKYITNPPKKVCSFFKIENRTYEHIDTNAILESIKTALIKSSRVKVIDIDKRELLHQELNRQAKNRYHFQSVTRIGKELGADAIFLGDISAIYQKNIVSKDMYYKLTLNLYDVQKGEIVWSDEVEIRKIYTRKLIGW